MSITMYHGSVPVFLQLLPALSGALDKGHAFAEARKFDPALLLQVRLAPDMFPLVRQVQQATAHALAPGRIAGVELPKLADGATIAELKQRIATTVDFLKGLQPGQIDGKEQSDVTVKLGPNDRTFKAQVLLYHHALPNFYFHTTTAYDILRHCGVELGKRDFMGQMPG
ncbi:MAG TPA: DUF1993 domain-containing protein [Stellaceae bacterium]|nr:DUF1993 domain-containing protein [Stellaceae bacterium]